LVAGAGGDFIVIADGKELWNKNAMGGDFPGHETVLRQLR